MAFEGRIVRLVRIWAETGQWPREQFRYEMSFNWKRVALTIGAFWLAVTVLAALWGAASSLGLL